MANRGPYLLEAAKSRKSPRMGFQSTTHRGLANLIHPFWMLPVLGILGLKARGHLRILDAAVCHPRTLVLFLVWNPELHTWRTWRRGSVIWDSVFWSRDSQFQNPPLRPFPSRVVETRPR